MLLRLVPVNLFALKLLFDLKIKGKETAIALKMELMWKHPQEASSGILRDRDVPLLRGGG